MQVHNIYVLVAIHVNHHTDSEQTLLVSLTLASASMSVFTTSRCPLELAIHNGLVPP